MDKTEWVYCEYYDTEEGKTAHKGDAYKTDLGEFYKTMTGEDYNPKVEPTELYKKMNFAIIINAVLAEYQDVIMHILVISSFTL